MQPVIPDIGTSIGFEPVGSSIAIAGSFVLGLFIAWVYKATHRGLTYSQSFQFSLVLLAMLGAVVMMIASGGIVQAIGILGAFSLIRFRTAIKDPKDMAYILLVLAVGLAMGANLYLLALLTAGSVCVVILLLTWTNFGVTSRHEAVVRLTCTGKDGAQGLDTILEKVSDSVRLLSAHARGDRMEFTYGIRPRRGETAASILEALRREKDIEDAELFDAKHNIEF
jgi:uncharacterized membrane protein YhiD involved in acid resistance